MQFLEWLDYPKAIDVIKESDVGLVSHHAIESWNTTVPNKLFEYMLMGKPVIVSNAKPAERIVREERCGMVFKEMAWRIWRVRFSRGSKSHQGRNS